ncbi:MAG: hypothetical protein HYW45_02880 [Candidatus Daviesbacteria bacterium]|nr:MAG: hypothetical protein HYW45_02880 [Candidatus Daviesbacteria bacterium]
MKLLLNLSLTLILLLVGLYLLGTAYSVFIPVKKDLTWGLSFSPRYAKELNLDPPATFEDILANFKVKNIRLSAYWDEIEPFDSSSTTSVTLSTGSLTAGAQGKPFYFEDLDYYINQAAKYQAQVILVLGHKIPRWPECYYPGWLDSQNNSLRQSRQLIMLEEAVKHYRSFTNIAAFQIENEPLLPFGNCQLDSREFIKKEVDLVRSYSQKPIILSDSGELRPWVTAMKLSDIFGTTLYRRVKTPFNFDFTYPFPPIFYSLKSALVRNLFAPQNKKTIIVELQAEPWLFKGVTQTPIEEQTKIFNLKDLQDNIEFAEKTGFDSAYLWGVEWWYFMAKAGHPEYLEKAKALFRSKI